MSTHTEYENPEIPVACAREIYLVFLNNMLERIEDSTGALTDEMARENDPQTLLALQKQLKRTQQRAGMLRHLSDGIRPIQLMDIITDIADPDVKNDLQPLFDVVKDLRDALGLTVADIREARHE